MILFLVYNLKYVKIFYYIEIMVTVFSLLKQLYCIRDKMSCIRLKAIPRLSITKRIVSLL